MRAAGNTNLNMTAFYTVTDAERERQLADSRLAELGGCWANSLSLGQLWEVTRASDRAVNDQGGSPWIVVEYCGAQLIV
jgi:hypothetical protein